MALEDRREAAEMLEGKQSKQSVDYRPSSEETDEDWCGACVHYIDKGKPASRCAQVAGTVYDSDVCDLFEEDMEAQAEEEVPREVEREVIDQLF